MSFADRWFPGSGRTPLAAGCASAVALLLLTACVLSGPPVRNPSVVGVIVSSELTNVGTVFELENGQSVEIQRAVTLLEGSRGGGDPGTLLFHRNGNEPFYFGLTVIAPHARPGCFDMDGPAVDDGTHISFKNGLRLPKAPDFDGQGWPRNGRYDKPAYAGGGYSPFCVNLRGEVTVYRSEV